MRGQLAGSRREATHPNVVRVDVRAGRIIVHHGQHHTRGEVCGAKNDREGEGRTVYDEEVSAAVA